MFRSEMERGFTSLERWLIGDDHSSREGRLRGWVAAQRKKFQGWTSEVRQKSLVCFLEVFLAKKKKKITRCRVKFECYKTKTFFWCKHIPNIARDILNLKKNPSFIWNIKLTGILCCMYQPYLWVNWKLNWLIG